MYTVPYIFSKKRTPGYFTNLRIIHTHTHTHVIHSGQFKVEQTDYTN